MREQLTLGLPNEPIREQLAQSGRQDDAVAVRRFAENDDDALLAALHSVLSGAEFRHFLAHDGQRCRGDDSLREGAFTSDRQVYSDLTMASWMSAGPACPLCCLSEPQMRRLMHLGNALQPRRQPRLDPGISSSPCADVGP